jgi:hypothetical protein
MSISAQGLGLVTVAAADTPQPLSATPLEVKDFWIRPCKAAAGTANTGNIYIGNSAMVKGTGVGVIFLLKTGDAPLHIERPRTSGEFYDLSQWYIDADNNSDGALIGYEGQ